MPDPQDDRYLLLIEIARLTAALLLIVKTIDDPVLKAEIASLIWPTDSKPPHPFEVP